MTFITKETIIHHENSKKYIRDYWCKRAADFAQLRSHELHSNKQLLWKQEILRHIPSDKKLTILDIGCGTGFFSILLAQEGHHVTGIDLTPDMIDYAKKLACTEQVAADFMVMDAEETAFSDHSFDLVIARNLMWNLPDPKKAYAEWLRILKPGGILLNYDAEYAKNHHAKNSGTGAHALVSNELMEECHKIYHMLDISLYNRPLWDQQVLAELNCSHLEINTSISDTIYKEYDNFYVPVPMFCVKAIK